MKNQIKNALSDLNFGEPTITKKSPVESKYSMPGGPTPTKIDNDELLHEFKSRIQYGKKKVDDEYMPLDNYLENLELTCGQVRSTHRDRLIWKFKPKLDLAKEKVDKLEKIVANKQKLNEQKEELLMLKQHIEQRKDTKKKLLVM